MASRASIVDYLVDQMGAGVSAKKMFGDYGLYLDGVLFALICDNQLFVKPTTAGRVYLDEIHEAPPYAGAKAAFLIDNARWEDDRWIRQLAQLTVAELKRRKVK